MRYVLDSNVGLKWVLDEDLSDEARAVRDEYRKNVHELLAPDVFPVEVAHTLSRAVRAGRIKEAEANAGLSGVLGDCPQLHPFLSLLPRAFAISLQARIGVYDCLYVALAEREGCELLTADDRLQRSLPGHPIVLLSSLP
jgi:predicted nucleic acid-binding protein